jgi:hypothetical protein
MIIKLLNEDLKGNNITSISIKSLNNNNDDDDDKNKDMKISDTLVSLILLI